jgi:hypothetical protein
LKLADDANWIERWLVRNGKDWVGKWNDDDDGKMMGNDAAMMQREDCDDG